MAKMWAVSCNSYLSIDIRWISGSVLCISRLPTRTIYDDIACYIPTLRTDQECERFGFLHALNAHFCPIFWRYIYVNVKREVCSYKSVMDLDYFITSFYMHLRLIPSDYCLFCICTLLVLLFTFSSYTDYDYCHINHISILVLRGISFGF